MLVDRLQSRYYSFSRKASLCLLALFSSCVLQLCVPEVVAQKRDKNQPPPTIGGPKRDKSAPPPVKDGEAKRPVIERVIVRPTEGYLTLSTTPSANVSLRQLIEKSHFAISRRADADGLLKMPKLKPGSYRLEIELEDYEPHSEIVKVTAGEPTALIKPLRAKFGAVIFDLDSQESTGVKVKLDGRELPTGQLNVEKGMIIIPRVPVGEHTLKLTKDGYDDWERKVEVGPGERKQVAVRLELVTITLTVKSRPQAKVYIDGVQETIISSEGTVAIPNLRPGLHQMTVLLDGYESQKESLKLKPDQRGPVINVPLVPIASSGEARAVFELGLRQWNPQPTGWRIETGSQQGLRVSGDQVVLFKDVTERRPTNVYFDFKLVMDLRFLNNKGAAWVVRARDLKNYYLFELAPPSSDRQPASLKFFVCREGVLELKDNTSVPVKIDRQNETYRLAVEARGNKFKVNLESRGEDNTIGNFTDGTFSYGGIGLRAINGIDMLVQQLVIIPKM